MRAQSQVMGIVAGSTVLAILTTALTLRRISYEAFYVTHVTLFMLLIIALGLHRPFFYGKAIYIFIFTAGIWALDRVYRFSKISWFVYGNTASVVPLGQKGVRIELSRTPERAVPGTHVFLWIPKIRVTETHPFTIVSCASRNPGTKLRASCDGPYGTLPKFSNFDHVILIAGGSGASFTFGVALDLVRRANVSTGGPIIHFIWVVREPSK
jgi:predicted ferric reductase